MRVLLDECVDARLAAELKEFDVRTVAEQGWTGVTNGKLLGLAAGSFDVFVTVDRNLSFQQHLPKFDIAVVLLRAPSNRLADLLPLIPSLGSVLPMAPRRQVTDVGA